MIKLIDFYADWCGPCQVMKPIFEELKTEMKDKVEFVQVNVDSDSATAQKYGVMSIPTFVIEKDGAEASRKIGALSKDAFASWINSSL